MSLDEKLKIVMRARDGESISEIARSLHVSRSTIGSILKNKQNIFEHAKSISVSMKAKRVYKRNKIIVQMENLLKEWLEEQNLKHIPFSTSILRQKASSIYQTLLTESSTSSENHGNGFVASRGWFNRFRIRAKLHNIELQSKSRSSDVDVAAAKEFIDKLDVFINANNYQKKQIFNVDETGLCWKKMPDRTYLSNSQNSVAGQKTIDRLTLLLGGNASGDFKLKPMLIYCSENPRALKGIVKASLPVIWKSNKKTWVTQPLFQEWFLHYFVPEAKQYCLTNDIPFKILLIIDNATGHSPNLDNLHPDIKVLFTPPNTTALIQPMNQGVIASFKAYYARRTITQAVEVTQDSDMTLADYWKKYNIYAAIKNVSDSWGEVKLSNMKGVWRNLCPQFFHNEPELIEDYVTASNEVLIEYGKRLGLEITENTVTIYIDEQPDEFEDEQFEEIEEGCSVAGLNYNDSASEVQKEFNTNELKEAFHLIETGLKKIERLYPNSEMFMKINRMMQEGLKVYKDIYNS